MAVKATLKKRKERLKELNLFDPRQERFLALYLDPKSKTFGNVVQSGLGAGFAQKYADNLMQRAPEWLVSGLEKSQTSIMLERAQRNLAQILDLQTRIPAMGAFGPIYEKIKNKKGKVIKKIPVLVESVGLLKVKADTSQFVAERIGRKIYGKDSEDPKGPPIANFTQIIINPPHGATKDAGDQPDAKAVPRVVSAE